MYSIEVIDKKNDTQRRWIACISENKIEDNLSEIKKYHKLWEMKDLGGFNYPLIVVETIDQSGNNLFEYYDYSRYMEVNVFPPNRSEYLIAEPLFWNCEIDQMGSLPHFHFETEDDDSGEPEDERVNSKVRLITDYLDDLGYNENLSKLDELSRLWHNGCCKSLINNLAEAYLDVFNQWLYDLACGKLNPMSETDLLYPVNRAEFLTGTAFHEYSCSAYLALIEMDIDCGESCENLERYLHLCLKHGETHRKISSVDVSRVLHYQAVAHHHMLEKTGLKFHWNEAVRFTRESLHIDSDYTSWSYYLRLISPASIGLWAGEGELEHLFADALGDFEALAGNDPSPERALHVARGFERLKSDPSMWSSRFEESFVNWVNKAAAWDPSEKSLCDLREGALFFLHEGKRLGASFLMEKSVSALLLYMTSGKGDMELGYLSECYQALADIYQKRGDAVSAKQYLQKALTVYQDNWKIVADNISLLINYTEFFIECLETRHNDLNLSLETIEPVIQIALEQGRGLYYQPHDMGIKSFLYKNEGGAAITEIKRALLIFECTIEKDLCELLSWLSNKKQEIPGDFEDILKLCNETLDLFSSFGKGYYWNPPYTNEEILGFDAKKISVLWENRKSELLKTFG